MVSSTIGATKHANPKEHKRSQREREEARTGWTFMSPFLILFGLVFIFPILYAIYASLTTQRVTGSGAFGGGERETVFAGFSNYAYVLTSTDFWNGIGRVILYTILQVPFMIGFALLLALLVDSFILKHISGFRLSYFLPYAIPGVAAAIIWVYLYNPTLSPLVKFLHSVGVPVDFFADGWNILSMANITTWTFTGYNMLIFLAALQAIPHDLYEAARLDGASGFQIATKIKIPNVRGAALLAMLLSIVGTIQLFNEPQIMQTADPGISNAFTPMMMALNTMKGSLTPQGPGPASAISIVMALIAGVLAVGYFLAERKLSK